MPTLKLHDDSLTLTLTTRQSLYLTHAVVAQVLEQLCVIAGAIPLTRISLEERPAEAGVYDYLIRAVDGRKWKQVIYTAGQQYRMTFSCSDQWTADEFSQQRALRDAICRLLIRNHGLQSLVAIYP